MPRGYDYRVFDCETCEWLPGVYRTKGIRELLGMKSHPSEYAASGLLVKRRYQIVFADEEEDEVDQTWPERWEDARMKILEGRKR